MTIAWGGICCSKPPCVTVSVRKERHTYPAVLARKAFTVSVPSETYARQADYAGMASGAKVDKFAAMGLTPAKSDLVDAPYVQEFPLILECKLLQAIDLGAHTQFIGEIMESTAPVLREADCQPPKSSSLPLSSPGIFSTAPASAAK